MILSEPRSYPSAFLENAYERFGQRFKDYHQRWEPW